jgi:endonuclease YncB( thermonuclease family)
MNKIVYLECLGSDKYGRILGKIFLNKNDEKCVNDIIVETGLCKKYIL